MNENFFKKRSGTTDRGSDYEDIIVANLILKLVKDDTITNFRLSSNDGEFGAFDDVVLEKETNTTKQIQALQLKHANREKVLTKSALTESRGNFSIQKYFEDFNKLKKVDFPIQFILFTNLKFDDADGKKIKLKNSEVKIVQAQPDPLLNTSVEGRCYRFEAIEEEFQEFLNSFVLYTNQANVERMKMQVSDTFENMFSCSKIPLNEYLDFVSKWSDREGTKPKLDSIMTKHVITLCLLSQQIVPFCFEKDGYVDPNSKLLRKAISQFNTSVFKFDNMDRIKRVYGDAQYQLKEAESTNTIGMKYQIRLDITNIDDKEKTKLLWMTGKFPLIVIGDLVSHKAISLCKNEHFIILSNEETRVQFRTLSDLNPNSEIFGEILNNFDCSIQGKAKFKLRTLLEENEDFCKIISTDQLLEMLDDSFSVGGTKENLPVPYVYRLISMNTIDYRVLEEFEDDSLVVISCRKQFNEIREHLSQFRIRRIEDLASDRTESCINSSWSENLTEAEVKTIYVSEDECLESQFKEVCKKNPKKNRYHQFRVVSGKLEWVQGDGDFGNLHKNRLSGDFTEESEFSMTYTNIQLVCADPGMGKSVLMRSIKNQQKPTFWTVLISPKGHSFFQGQNADAFIEYILDVTRKELSGFESQFLKILMEKRQVIFIWDGLDEISQKKINIILNIITEISEKKFVQFVAARNNLKKALETTLNVFARNIKPFDKKEQSRYIMSKLNLSENDETIEKIIENIEIIRCREILGIPLHIYMLTELFLQNRHKFSTLCQNHFSVTDLYHYFVDEKFNFYFREKAKLDTSSDVIQDVISTSKKDRLRNYEKASLRLVFSKRSEPSTFLEEIRKNSDCFGVITNVTSAGLPVFIHESFGEYFVASYLVKNRHKVENVQTLIFEEKFTNIRFFFDLLLAEDCPAHIAVLYKNSQLLMSYKEALHQADKGGRSPLHLACSWGARYYPLIVHQVGWFGVKYDEPKAYSKRENLEVRQILEFLTLYCVPYQVDEIFKMDAFSYANKSCSFFAMLYLAKIRRRCLTSFDNFKDIQSVLVQSVKLDYTEIFDIPDIARVIQIRFQKILIYSFQWNSTSVLKKLLNYKNINTRDLPISIACHQRNIDVLLLVIRLKANLNTVNKVGNTPLYVACKYGHFDIVKLLVTNKADINNGGTCQKPPIFAACFNGHLDIVKFLINSGANINLRTRTGETPLHWACSGTNTKIAKVLIDLGTDINTGTYYNATPLYMACHYGRTEMVGFLLDSGADLCIPTSFGVTPLHAACFMGYSEIVRTLIAAQADVNVAVKDGTTPLHAACSEGYTEIVKVLLDSEAYVNSTDRRRQTALYLACEYQKTEVVRLLLKVGADARIRTSFGKTPLQVATSKGYSEIVTLLLVAGNH